MPLIAIGPPADGGGALRAALNDVAGFDWVVVTSSNGAAAVGDAVAGAPGVRLAAVGPATARALEAQSGRPVDLVPADANSDGLLAAFPSASCRVLLAQADRAGEHLAAGLRSAGHDVVAVEAYATRPVDTHALPNSTSSNAPMPSCWPAVRRWRAGRVRPGRHLGVGSRT